jgi:hypothetical protein
MKAVIECDPELYAEISTKIQCAIVGKPIFLGDSFANLLNRHCVEVQELAKKHGYLIVPNTDKALLESVPPRIAFDIVKIVDALSI